MSGRLFRCGPLEGDADGIRERWALDYEVIPGRSILHFPTEENPTWRLHCPVCHEGPFLTIGNAVKGKVLTVPIIPAASIVHEEDGNHQLLFAPWMSEVSKP